MKRTLKRLHDPTWLVLPDDVNRRIEAWRRVRPAMPVDTITGFTGLDAHALTVTDSSVPDSSKKVLLFVQPHGHEPAQTAGAMDVLSELITGRSLDGRRTRLDVPSLLRRLVIVINPLGNPDGRSRMPWEVFDYNVDMIEGPYYWSGKLRGQDYEWMLPAFPPGHFNRSEHDFDPDYPIALRYEQISEDEFWDPWHESPADLRDNPTSAARLARTLIDRHAVDAVIDLHQQMQLDNVRLWVAQYQGAAQERADRISQRIEDDWARAGFHVSWRLRHRYEHLIKALFEYSGHAPVVTVEVGCGVGYRNAIMHRKVQGEACASAIRSVLNLHAGL